ncbi:hypothetical protein ElyMa_003606000 [Elysia marginata]|uniref:Secreted protein n=1 Tax=Elysia marginata TaxID=1093978 RepID=A0AAV4ESV6_9GAST|nr:hypothetical protein ElyMa_003606000 [Elysia marginata]
MVGLRTSVMLIALGCGDASACGWTPYWTVLMVGLGTSELCILSLVEATVVGSVLMMTSGCSYSFKEEKKRRRKRRKRRGRRKR